MAQTRVQVPNLDAPEKVQPAASPVQRTISPQAPPTGPNGAQQLAQALSGIQPSLQNYLVQKDDRYIQGQADDARATRLRLAVTYQDAVKQGSIPADQSPFFVRAYKEADGRVAADQYNQDLITSLATGPFASSLDPKETDPLMNTFRQNWMQAHGISGQAPEFLDGFVKQADAYESNARAHQSAAVSDRVVEHAKQNLFYEVQNALDEVHTRDLAPEAVAEGIGTLLNRGVFVGMDPKELNKIVVDAAAAKALDTGQGVLIKDILDKVKTGPGFLGKTRTATDTFEEISSRLASQLQAADHYAAWKEEERTKQINREASSSILSVYNQNRLQGRTTSLNDVPGPLATLSGKDGDHALYESLTALIANSGKATQKDKEDPAEANHFYETLFRNPSNLDRASVIRSMRQGIISEETAADLVDRQDRYERETKSEARQATEDYRSGVRFSQEQQDRSNTSVVRNPVVEQELENVNRAFSQEGTLSFDSSKAVRQGQARVSFLREMDDWLHANPKATFQDQLKKAGELRRAVIDGFGDNTYSLNPGQTSGDIINNSPGVKAGRFAPITSPSTSSPAADRGKSGKEFLTKQEWDLAHDAFLKAKPADRPNTALGAILKQRGITGAQLNDWINAQNALY